MLFVGKMLFYCHMVAPKKIRYRPEKLTKQSAILTSINKIPMLILIMRRLDNE